jgi:hypothetical protein
MQKNTVFLAKIKKENTLKIFIRYKERSVECTNIYKNAEMCQDKHLITSILSFNFMEPPNKKSINKIKKK